MTSNSQECEMLNVKSLIVKAYNVGGMVAGMELMQEICQ